MGFLIKFIAFILVIYFLIKFGKFILKSIFYLVMDKPQDRVNHRKARPKDGNVDIDFIPDDYNKSNGAHKGDYVDYEEIK